MILKIFDLVYEDEFAVVKKSIPTLRDYQYKAEMKLMNHINPIELEENIKNELEKIDDYTIRFQKVYRTYI